MIATNPVVIEQILIAPAEAVWKAITDKDEMKKWYFDLQEFHASPGFIFQFTGGPSPERQYEHICQITRAIPNCNLTYSWRYEGYDGMSFVSFNLTTQEDKTLLTLSHKGLETFPADNPDLARENFVKGWTLIIQKSLKEYLEKRNREL